MPAEGRVRDGEADSWVVLAVVDGMVGIGVDAGLVGVEPGTGGGAVTVTAVGVEVEVLVLGTGAGGGGTALVTVVIVVAGTVGVDTPGRDTLVVVVVGVGTETVTVVTGVATVVVGTVTVGSTDPRDGPTASTFAAQKPIAATQAIAIGRIARRITKRPSRNKNLRSTQPQSTFSPWKVSPQLPVHKQAVITECERTFGARTVVVHPCPERRGQDLLQSQSASRCREAGASGRGSSSTGAKRSPCRAIRSSTPAIPKSLGRSPDLSSSHRNGVDTGAPGLGRTE